MNIHIFVRNGISFTLFTFMVLFFVFGFLGIYTILNTLGIYIYMNLCIFISM